eukprot:jgi/Mesen1/10560/ME000843S10073
MTPLCPGSQQRARAPPPPAPGRTRRMVDIEEDLGCEREGDGDEGPLQSQEQVTQHYSQRLQEASQRAATNISQEEVDKCVSEVMRCMLFRAHKEPGVPVRRDELTQLVNRHYQGRHGFARRVILEAQARFPA